MHTAHRKQKHSKISLSDVTAILCKNLLEVDETQTHGIEQSKTIPYEAMTIYQTEVDNTSKSNRFLTPNGLVTASGADAGNSLSVKPLPSYPKDQSVEPSDWSGH